MKSFLRVSTLVLALAIFIFSMRSFFPEWLLQYPLWRYLLIIIVIVIAYMAIRQVGTFLTNMAIVLRASEENIRFRLLLESAIWPVRLLLIALAVYVAREFLYFSPTAERIADTIVTVFSTLAVVIFF